MRTGIVFFALGVWWLQREPELPSLAGAVLLLLPLLAAGTLRARTAPAARAAAWAALAVFACGAGFFWAATMAHLRLADALAPEWEGRDVDVIGVVASLPQAHERSVRFELEVEQVVTRGARVPRRVLVSWWGRPDALPQVHAGERWRFTVRMKRPHGAANPHGFDYEAWLLERGIRATGYVRPRPAPERLAAQVHRPGYWVEVARERLRTRILHALQNQSYAGVIAALAIGDQRAIPAHQWQIFTRTGVNHLMSISGLHVTMVAALAYAVARGLWRRSARLTLAVPAPKAAALAGLLAAYLYTLLAGFAVPAQRTLYMVAVVAIALWSGTVARPSVVLAAALFVVLVLDPWAVNAAGFWLSFGAVAAIFVIMANRVARPRWFSGWLRTQTAVTVALLAPLLALFQQVSLISPFANAFAIPLVSLVVVPLALAGTVLPVDALLHLAHLAVTCCMRVLEWMSALPDAVWQQHAPVPWALAVAVLGTVWMLLPRGFPARWLGAIACVPLFTAVPPSPTHGDLHLVVLDVGQGLSVLVRTARHALLYDTGPAFGASADSGDRIVAPYLRAAGVSRLSGMIVSHDDIDHTGGAISVLRALAVDWVATSLPEGDPLPMFANEAFRCQAGQRWTWDGVLFEILHPSGGAYREKLKDNDLSCVLRVVTPTATVLLPGDIERRGEALLLGLAQPLAADVLVAPHQGSRTSSTAAFVEAVRPKWVVFPVGYRNRFGHPHPEVVERYRALGSELLRTDRDGAVLISIGRDGTITAQRWREQHRRYWLAAPSQQEGVR